MATSTTPPRSLGLSLEPGADTPLYQQIFDALSARIRAGTLPAGYRLPPTRRLAEELGAHRNTVVRAYQELEEAGYLSSTVGRGTFVAELPERGEADDPPARPPLPWASLAAPGLTSEPLLRASRLPRPTPGEDVVDLTRMQPPAELVPHELFARCVQHVLRTRGARALGYGSATRDGVPALREQIAKDLARQGVPAHEDDVLVTSGSQQALDLIVRALTRPGDRVLTSSATYSGAVRLFAAAGVRLDAVPEDDDGPTVAGLAAAGKDARFVYLMPNHENPRGRVLPTERRDALVQWSHRAGVPLVEDDYAADLVLDDVATPVAMRALSAEVIHVGTFSKKLIPALRIGYLVCPPGLRPHLANLKHAMDLGSSVLLQHALAEFLERDYLNPHLGRVRRAYRARRDALLEALARHLPDGVRYDEPTRGVTLWLELPSDVDSEAVYAAALEEGVLVSPGSLHRVAGGTADGVRLNFCFEPEARLAEGAKRLGRALERVLSKSTPAPSPPLTVI